MPEIALSSPVRGSLNVLQLLARQQAEATERLATGLRANSAVADPINFHTGRTLNARAGELEAITDRFVHARGAVESAQHAFEAARGILDEMQTIADDALANAKPTLKAQTLVVGDRTVDPAADLRQLVLDAGGADILVGNARNRRIGIGVTATSGNGYRFFQYGSDGTTVQDFQDWANGQAEVDASNIKVSRGADGKMAFTRTDPLDPTYSDPLQILSYNEQLTQVLGLPGSGYHWGATADLPRTITGWAGGIDRNTTFRDLAQSARSEYDVRWSDGQGNTFDYAVTGAQGNTRTVGDLIDAVNADDDFGWSLDLTGEGRLEWTSDVGVNNFIVTPRPWFQYHQNLGLLSPHGNSANASKTHPDSVGRAVASPSQLAPPTEAHTRYLELYDQLEGYLRDASFLGTSLLDGDQVDLTVNERGTRQRVGSFGIEPRLHGVTRVERTDFLLIDGIGPVSRGLEAMSDELDRMITRVGTQSAVLSIREDFNRGIVATLRAGAGEITLADANEEGANLLAVNTRTQLASNTLSLATQADRGVLRLFG